MSKQNKNEQTKAMEEAIQPRLREQDPQEQTQEEILTQALNDASVEERLTNLEDPSPQSIQKMSQSPIPVLNTAPPPAIPNSSQESPPMNVPPQETRIKENIENDPDLKALKDFIFGDSFNERSVDYILSVLCSQPHGLPYPGTWLTARDFSLSNVVYTILTTKDYLESIWIPLKNVMGTNVGNSSWSASVATSIALYDAITLSPALAGAEIQKILGIEG